MGLLDAENVSHLTSTEISSVCVDRCGGDADIKNVLSINDDTQSCGALGNLLDMK